MGQSLDGKVNLNEVWKALFLFLMALESPT